MGAITLNQTRVSGRIAGWRLSLGQCERTAASARLASMDERAIKRLLVILAVSIIAIFLFKSMMTRTIGNLGRVAAEKKQAAATPPAVQQDALPASNAATVVETPAGSSVGEVSAPESSVASAVSGAQ